MSNSTKPARIDDRLAIQDVLHSHCRGLDRNDGALIAASYWPDAEVDYGSFKGSAGQFAELIGPALSNAYELTRHRISNTLIDFDGATARVESYVEASHLLTGGASEMRFGGRYLDTLEQREDEWRMLHRQVVMDWSTTRDVADERQWEAFTALSKGSNDGSDPLHTFLQGGAKHG